jgi:uncharacterized protein (DUF2147 family)
MKKIGLILSMLMLPMLMFSQSIEGLWKTVDDKTGKAKSVVRIYKNDGKLYGKIIKLIDNDEENPLCTACNGDLKNEPIKGMQIINGLELNKGKWEGHDGILDPDNGKLYKCKIWAENDRKLNVRGYIGPVYRTQTWYRYQ